MKFTLSILAGLVLAVAAFGQAGETLPNLSGGILVTGAAPVNGTDEVQTLTFGATITGGSFTATFDGETSGAIAWSSTNAVLVANIDAGLEAMANIGTGGVTTAEGTITSGANGTVTVTFTGNNAKKNVAQMTVTESLTGSASTLAVSTTTAGVTADGRISAKGTPLVDLATGIVYVNTGTPPAPTWTRVANQASSISNNLTLSGTNTVSGPFVITSSTNAGVTGQIGKSGTNLMYFNGTGWVQLDN